MATDEKAKALEMFDFDNYSFVFNPISGRYFEKVCCKSYSLYIVY